MVNDADFTGYHCAIPMRFNRCDGVAKAASAREYPAHLLVKRYDDRVMLTFNGLFEVK